MSDITHYSASICQSNAYSDNHFTNLIQTGQYYDTLQNVDGCDSIICLTLTIDPVPTVLTVAIICKCETYNFDSKLLTEEGTYHDILQSIHACDSLIELMLIITNVGINNYQLNVYPNPTTGQLRIGIAGQARNDVNQFRHCALDAESPFKTEKGYSEIRLT